MKNLLLTVVGAGLLVAGFEANAQILLATTNEGELVEIDLMAGTATLIGDAGTLEGSGKEAGWTGLSFDAAGDLFVVSKQSSELNTGCTGSPLTTKGNCAHLYRVDPSTGAVIGLEVGNTQTPFLSDIDFDFNGTLFGNQWDSRGTLVTVDSTTGTATAALNNFGTKTNRFGVVVELQNGGLSVDPGNGEIWAIETGFRADGVEEPAIFRVDAGSGLIIPPAIQLGLFGAPLTFGFDSLEILPDGRFIATRSEGRSEVYEINPVADAISGLAEITLIPLLLDPGMQGSLNGLEFFQLSPDPLVSLTNDIINLGLSRRTTRILTRQLERVQRRIDRGRLARARDGICVFIERLDTAVSDGELTASDANALLKDASKILGDIEFQ